jgi:hypothetical protein
MEGTLHNHRSVTVADAVQEAAAWDDYPLPMLGMHRLGSRPFSPFPEFRVLSRRQFENSREPWGSHATDVAPTLQGPETAVAEHDEATASADSRELPECNPLVAGEPLADQIQSTHEISPACEEPSAPGSHSDADARPSLTQQLQQHLQTLQGLSKRAAIGDQAAIAEIQQILNSNAELWHYLGDVERATEAMLVEYLSGPPEVKESVRRATSELKRSLLAPDSTPLESLAVGRVVHCWLFANFVDRWAGFAIKESGRTSGVGKVLESSEKRLQTALKSLKLVQSMKASSAGCVTVRGPVPGGND